MSRPAPNHDPLCSHVRKGHGDDCHVCDIRGCDCDFIAKVRADEKTALTKTISAIHQPKHDPPMSLVSWASCSCGAMETFTAEDGYLSIGPARYPCATVRALTGES